MRSSLDTYRLPHRWAYALAGVLSLSIWAGLFLLLSHLMRWVMG